MLLKLCAYFCVRGIVMTFIRQFTICQENGNFAHRKMYYVQLNNNNINSFNGTQMRNLRFMYVNKKIACDD